MKSFHRLSIASIAPVLCTLPAIMQLAFSRSQTAVVLGKQSQLVTLRPARHHWHRRSHNTCATSDPQQHQLHNTSLKDACARLDALLVRWPSIPTTTPLASCFLMRQTLRSSTIQSCLRAFVPCTVYVDVQARVSIMQGSTTPEAEQQALQLVDDLQQQGVLPAFGRGQQLPKRIYTMDELRLNKVEPTKLLSPTDESLNSIRNKTQVRAAAGVYSTAPGHLATWI